MNARGLLLASRYAYPPNSLSLCGPEKQSDLVWYSGYQTADIGTKEILQQFGTLYPYLRLIAAENKKDDPFDPEVVEAYWIGNSLLKSIKMTPFMKHLTEDLQLRKRLPKKNLESLAGYVANGALPFHNFHVLGIYRRTGNIPEIHTIQTMDACMIHSGKIIQIENTTCKILTKPLILTNGILSLGSPITRIVSIQGVHDHVASLLQTGDWISYHWGQICEHLSPRKLRNLNTYTAYILSVINSQVWQNSSVSLVHS